MVDDNNGSLFDDNELRTLDSQEPRAVQESLFDIGPSEQIGYRVPITCQVVGISYHQLDYWARTRLVEPSIRTARGSSTQHLYSFRDILILEIVHGLLDTGVFLQNIRLAVDRLRNLGADDLATITLVSDDRTVYQCRSNEEIIGLLNGGQGVFGIAVPDIMKELTGTTASFPSERISGTRENPGTGIGELAERRRRHIS